MEINRAVVGYLEENCYILKKNEQCLIIDPGDEFAKLKPFIEKLNIVGILLTHHHDDHIGAVDTIMRHYHCPVYDNQNLQAGVNQLGDFSFSVLLTPGHTSDSISFYFPDQACLFCGDFIFQNSIGRMDLPTGSEVAMKQSIDQIKTYPKDTVIYPGHGPKTTLGDEIQQNYYFNHAL